MPANSDNIIYLDFDGTLTGAPGKDVIGTELCTTLKDVNTPEGRATYKSAYENSEDKVKITNGTKKFLNEMNKLHPTVQIVIISRNYENYIRALLEFENIDTKNITIYPRGKGRELGPGEDKNQAVINHEINLNPGFRLICDDDENDLQEMDRAAARKEGNIISANNAKPGTFQWETIINNLKKVLAPLLPVEEYLNGSTANRFHLYSVTPESITGRTGAFILFKDKYKTLSGDDLKRAILNNLKRKVNSITDSDELKKYATEYKTNANPEYQTLCRGQGLMTRLFNFKTDSQVAVDLIFQKRADDLEPKADVTSSP